MDPNAHLRNELLRDAEAMCRRIGAPPDAVLISGDEQCRQRRAARWRRRRRCSDELAPRHEPGLADGKNQRQRTF